MPFSNSNDSSSFARAIQKTDQLLESAELFIDQGDFSAALNNAKEISSIAEESNISELGAKALLIEAQIYLRKNELELAEEKYYALIDYQYLDCSLAIRGLNGLANIAALKGDFTGSEQFLLQALTMIDFQKGQTAKENEAIKRILANLSVICRSKGDLEKSLFYLEQSIELCERLKDESCLISSYANAGKLYLFNLLFEKAVSYFMKAIELCEQIQAKVYLAEISSYYAESLIMLGKFEQAEKILKQAASLAEELRLEYLIALAKSTKAILLFEKKAYRESHSQINEAIRYLQKTQELENFEILVKSLEVKIKVGLELDLLREIHEDIKQALRITKEQTVLPFYLIFLNLNSMFLAAEMDFNKAKELLQRAIKLSRENNLPIHQQQSKDNLELISRLEKVDEVYDFVISQQKRKQEKAKVQESTLNHIQDYIKMVLETMQ
ncbi:MAG: tetratricopeptide repeat protein [Candidatus Heimdallarchaeota archaeon]|nr:tetratricopeptide repeat protein [Candidatus Heimdallarchaeota archaeon]